MTTWSRKPPKFGEPLRMWEHIHDRFLIRLRASAHTCWSAAGVVSSFQAPSSRGRETHVQKFESEHRNSSKMCVVILGAFCCPPPLKASRIVKKGTGITQMDLANQSLRPLGIMSLVIASIQIPLTCVCIMGSKQGIRSTSLRFTVRFHLLLVNLAMCLKSRSNRLGSILPATHARNHHRSSISRLDLQELLRNNDCAIVVSEAVSMEMVFE